jgi:hypothetical protein
MTEERGDQQVAKREMPVLMPEYGLTLGELGSTIAKSGVFKDVGDAYKAMVKVMAGRELGLSPIASMTSIYIFDGKIVVGAQIYAMRVRQSENVRYVVTEHTTEKCSIEFHEGDTLLGTSTFTIEEAKKAGLAGKDNWAKYPRNMLYWRAMQNGVKFYCPEVMNGVNVSTPDDLGKEMAPSGDVIEAELVEYRAATPPVAAPVPPVETRRTPKASNVPSAQEWENMRQALKAIGTPDEEKAWLRDHFDIAFHEVTRDRYEPIMAAIAGELDERRAAAEVAQIVTATEPTPDSLFAAPDPSEIVDPFGDSEGGAA